MRRALLALIVAVVLLGVAFAVLAPATLLSSRVERATGGILALHGVEGTIWHGRGVLEGAGTQVPLSWVIEAMPLLRGELRAQIAPFDAQLTMPQAEVVATRQALTLTHLNAVLPAALITRAFANNTLRTIGFTANGDIAIASPRLDWKPGTIDGNVNVVWRGGQLMLPPLPALNLGDVTATLVANGARLAGPVTNQGGDLDVSGDLSAGADGSAAVSLVLAPHRADDVVLTRLLSSFGTRAGNGWRVAWQSPPR
jgi:hypothetical protein